MCCLSYHCKSKGSVEGVQRTVFSPGFQRCIFAVKEENLVQLCAELCTVWQWKMSMLKKGKNENDLMDVQSNTE